MASYTYLMLVRLTADTPPRQRPPWLVVAVALDDRPTRARIARLLWPESAHARSNLRVELHRLERGQFAGVVADDEDRLRLADGHETDVASARQAAASGDPEAALALVGPDLVPWGDDAPPAIVDWLLGHRDAWSVEYGQLLRSAATRAERVGDLDLAAARLREWQAHDPTAEEPYAELIRVAVVRGDDESARAHLAECRAMTLKAHGREPREATTHWVTRARPGSHPLIGRSSLIRTLRRAGVPTLLVGEPGLGKSRVAEEVAASSHRSLTVHGRHAGAPLIALGMALGSSRGSRSRAFITWLEQRSASDDPSLSGAVAALVESVGRGGCLIIEDLPLLDPSSLDALDGFLVTRGRLPEVDRPIVVATARPGDLVAGRGSDWVRRQLAQNSVRLQVLQRLTGSELTTLARSRSVAASPQLGDDLARWAGGNPELAIATLDEWVATGQVGIEAARGATAEVMGRVRQWYEVVDAAQRQVCHALAVADGPLSTGELSEVTDRDEASVAAALSELSQLLLVTAGAEAGGSPGWSLATPLHAAALRDGLPSPMLAAVSARVAQCWLARAARARRSSDGPGALAALDQADRLVTSAPARLELLAGRFDVLHALGDVSAARRLLGPLRLLADELPARRPELLVREARAHLDGAEYDFAIRAADQVLAGEPGPDHAAAALIVRGAVALGRGNFEAAIVDLRAAADLEPIDSTVNAVTTGRMLLSVLLQRGDRDGAEREAARLEHFVGLLGFPHAVAETELSLATYGAMTGNKPYQEAHARTALEVAERHGFGTIAAQARVIVAGPLLEAGRTHEAAALYEAALPSLPEARRPVALANLGTCWFQLGDLGRGLDAYAEAAELATQRGERAVALRRRVVVTEFRLRAGVPVAASEIEGLEAEQAALGSDYLTHYLASLALHAAVLRGDDTAALEQALGALTPIPDEQERHDWTLALAALVAGRRGTAVALLTDAEQTARVQVLRGLLEGGRSDLDSPWAVDLLLDAHLRSLRDPSATVERDRLLVDLEGHWPGHDGALRNLLARVGGSGGRDLG